METKESLAAKYTHIKGWGVDADLSNEPTHPIKKYTGDDHNRLNYDRPEQQQLDVDVLHSNERPSVSAVFGNTYPPSGLSGVIRRQAFKFSEGKIEHWLMLLLADRVNVVEGYLDDFVHGRVPNIFAEKGWKADWKYNKQAIAKRVGFTLLIATAVSAVIYRKNRKQSV